MIGRTLQGRYRVVSELGRGGMGVVYAARDLLLERDVAVKIVPRSTLTPEAEERVLREARTVARMDHPGIVPVHDLGRDDEGVWFVMPLLPGTTLRDHVKNGDLALGDVLETGVQVAEAVAYCHAHGVLHRDLKPGNVMVSREEGGRLRARVMDFGLARSRGDAHITRSGFMIGTLAYLSPEQVRGEEVDASADLYALGVLLYESILGRPPFRGEQDAVLHRILHEVPRSFARSGLSLDHELEQLILACLAKRKEDRPAHAALIASGLRAAQQRLSGDALSSQLLKRPQKQANDTQALGVFVGREKEYTALAAAFDSACTSNAQLCLLSGDPGTGRSRLVSEFAEQVRTRRALFVETRFSGDAEAAWAQLVRNFTIELHSLRPQAEAQLRALRPTLRAALPSLDWSDTGESESGTGPTWAGGSTPVPLAEALGRLFALAGMPMVLHLDDCHTAAVPTELFSNLMLRLAHLPVLFVVSVIESGRDPRALAARLQAAFAGKEHFSALRLGPLDRGSFRLLVEGFLGGSMEDDGFVEKLYAVTDGNPFFTLEILRTQLESSALVRNAAGHFVASTGVAPQDWPLSVRHVVEQRISDLPDDARELLQAAAVLGHDFPLETLSAVLGAEPTDRTLAPLIDRGHLQEITRDGEEWLVMPSSVMRSVLAAGLPLRRRRLIHQRAAEQLDARAGEPSTATLALVVEHAIAGQATGVLLRRAEHFAESELRLGHAASARRAAQALVSTAALHGDDTRKTRALLLLARSAHADGDDTAAYEAAQDCVRLVASGPPETRAEAELLRAESAFVLRRMEDVEAAVARGRAALAQAAHEKVIGLAARLERLASNLAILRGTAATAASAENAEESRTGGTLTVALSSPDLAQDPAHARTRDNTEVLSHIHETLFLPGDHGRVAPNLALGFAVSADGLRYEIMVRSGVRFHDGRVLDAAAVKTSLEHAIANSDGWIRAELGALEHNCIHAPSADVVQITLKEPLPILPALLAGPDLGIALPSANGQGFTGTGRFQIASWEPALVRLMRFDGHWGEQKPLLDALEFRPGMASASMAQGLKSNRLDVVRELSAADLAGVLTHPRLGVRTLESSDRSTWFVVLRANSGAFADAELRRNFLAATDVSALQSGVPSGKMLPAGGILPPGFLGFDQNRRTFTLDPATVRRQLIDNGVAVPLQLRAAVHPLWLDQHRPLLEGLLAQWKAAGFEVHVGTRDMAGYLSAMESPKRFDLVLRRWVADHDDPDTFAGSLFDSQRGLLRAWCGSKELDAHIKQGRSLHDAGERSRSYAAFEDALRRDAFVAPLFHGSTLIVSGATVRGLRLRGSTLDYSLAWKAAEESSSTLVRRRSGRIAVPLPQKLASLDPAVAHGLAALEVLPCIYDTLTRVHWGSSVGAHLARSVEPEAGALRWRIKLREDVRFHDGRELTTRDVRASFERLLSASKDSGCILDVVRGAHECMQGRQRALAGLQLLSDHELVVELSQPVPHFPVLLTHISTAILPELTVAPSRNYMPIGTGPFRVRAWEAGRMLELAAHTGWRRDVPGVQALEFRFGVRAQDALEGFRSGAWAMVSNLGATDAEALRTNAATSAGFHEVPGLNTVFLTANSRSGPLASSAARRSLMRMVSLPGVLTQIIPRRAVRAFGIIPPGMAGAVPQQVPPPVEVDEVPEILLQQELSALVAPLPDGQLRGVAAALFGALRAQGVRVRLVEPSARDFFRLLHEGSADLVLGRWLAEFPDPDSFAHGLFLPGSGLLSPFVNNPEIERLLTAARSEADALARRELYEEFEALLSREAIVLPLYHRPVWRCLRAGLSPVDLALIPPYIPWERLS